MLPASARVAEGGRGNCWLARYLETTELSSGLQMWICRGIHFVEFSLRHVALIMGWEGCLPQAKARRPLFVLESGVFEEKKKLHTGNPTFTCCPLGMGLEIATTDCSNNANKKKQASRIFSTHEVAKLQIDCTFARLSEFGLPFHTGNDDKAWNSNR